MFETKHGMARTRLYRTWANMKNRCGKEYDKEYKYYGGRGISVCKEWATSFEKFKEWALSNGYQDNLTIDRIDVNGNYEPKNCRWITRQEQNKNASSNIILSLNGVSHILADWSDIVEIGYSTLQGRVRRGWSDEEVLTTPVNKRYSRNQKHIGGTE